MSKIDDDTDRPPLELGALAAWFAEGVRIELAALEKDGGAKNYEVQSGKLVEITGPTQAIFYFIVADGTRIPEDATGRLKTANDEYTASVIGQEANRISIHLEGKAPPPPGIHYATLIIDDTALLRRLAEILEKVAETPTGVGPFATTVFHPGQARVGFVDLPDTPKITGELRRILEQACGSSITYIWGPPGTGKTFGIAHLIAALVENGERVLVTSHTHAAVDQILYEAVKSEEKKRGPLATHPTVKEGKVLRIGRTANKKIPDGVRLDKIVESKTQGIEDSISGLYAKAKSLIEKRAWYDTAICEWDKLTELTSHLQTAQNKIKQNETKRIQAEAAAPEYKAVLHQRRTELEQAQRAWFRRAAKTERATHALQDAEDELRKVEETHALALQEQEKAQLLVNEIQATLNNQRSVCKGFPVRETIEKELSVIAIKLEPIEEEIRALQDEMSQLEQKLIANARVIFCTLTKTYTGEELDEQKFDAVIIDEISMALPPLIFLAAGRATSRAVLVGDFLQLPPIVRSDTEVSSARLGKDIFHLAGVAPDGRPVKNCPVLTKRTTQYRMAPAIADVARHLFYGLGGLKDDLSVRNRKVSEGLDFLPENPLIIVDTADLHCWSGKQPGSLSRFNFYSANVAVELAAMVAARIPEPPEDKEPPIGIVTPYAAQRRLLSRLVKEMGLERWVAPGTVHTFQGGQAELIIFDSVLDEPYWTARLCNPQDLEEVKRDLNVAVTRAKDKFIFIGSSEWLNRHAKPTSALGQMWSLLKGRSDLHSAIELVGLNSSQLKFDFDRKTTGWSSPTEEKGYTFERLDEASFFDRFAEDILAASDSIFGLAPYFGEYRWPKVQPLISVALAKKIKVTIVTPPLSEAENSSYVKKAIKNLRDLGAIVVSASGLHGKDVIIDERIIYTGSMNWSSHRGRSEAIHRIDAPEYAKLCLEFMQAKHIRQAAIYDDGTPRICPYCGSPIQVVNQARQHGPWDFQAMKVGCTNKECPRGYLRNIDERPPVKEIPRCQIDGRTKYRRVRHGKGEIWQCPKHPKGCSTEKVVPGDPE